MKNLLTILFLALITIALAASVALVHGDSGGHSKKSKKSHKWVEKRRQRSVGVGDFVTPLYQEECGSCHMAYPPGLLIARSWENLMAGLEDHFDDNAELDAAVLQQLEQFLVEYSADHSKYRRSRKFARSLDYNDPPIRITETPYFLHKHDEVPASMVSQNPEVNSLSSCEACHKYAERGSFSEREIWIPGYGRWDD